MIVLTENEVYEALPKVLEGLRKYCWLQDNFRRCDVSKDRGFQRKYNDFYKVRRDADWRRHYYELMEKAKIQEIPFPEALRALRERTGRIEASFASKLVATRDPNKPVVDKFVLKNFGLRLPYHYAANRESRTIEVYEELCRRYAHLMGRSVARMICENFARMYPWAKITDLKKIDLVLWQTRK